MSNRKCLGPCGQWKSHMAFRRTQDPHHGTLFAEACRSCEKKARDAARGQEAAQ